METNIEAADEDVEDAVEKQLPVDMFYDYDQLESKASVSPESKIPLNLLHLSHSFGYDCKRRANLQLLDEQTVVYVAGNVLVLQDLSSKQQSYLRSCSGGGIGAITTHPSKQYFAVGEKGSHPHIIIYDYPSLRPYRILRGGTERAYCHLDFSADGELLASVGASPDYMLTLWDWRQEKVMLSCKAVSQDVYRVSFSPHNPGLLTSCGSGHIKFWKMASTFTGLKLQGLMGHFGKTAATDIEGYVVLPDGKVVSGSDWGNLLLWDGNSIKVEICRKEGRTCHAGTALPFALEEGQLLTMGADGAVRGWDLESIDGADSQGEGSCFELEPMNELVIGHNVSLSSVVRSGQHDFVWFAQDAMGAIWKLDLSFTHTTPDPERLFQFHCGAIQGLDVCWNSHVMATTAQGGSVRVFDFLSKKQLTSSHFNQGGTALCWAPPELERGGGLLTVGFEDGVVRLLDVLDPQRLQTVPGRSRRGEAELQLRQAFKPHSASVSAVAYERNARFLATASPDCSVFFFSAGEKFQPIGFVPVPGPVLALEWSPYSHRESRLLVLCQTGHVVEVHSPDGLDLSELRQSYQLFTLHTRTFCFKSIKSRIKREEEVACRQALKENKHEEREAQHRNTKNPELEPEPEEEKEELPPIHLPNPPSPLCCGFYSQPGRFWLSMGGYDAGFLYHCEFSEEQEVDPAQRQDEPFKALPLHNADQDPIISVTFSYEWRLLLCGMSSGSVRVYPLSPNDHNLESMKHYWTLSIHDNSYGSLRHLRVSHDEEFVLTAGDDGNIFSFSLLPPEKLPQHMPHAKVPPPRAGLEHEEVAQDIEDPSANSIETAKQRLESDRVRREAEECKQQKCTILKGLQKSYRELVAQNQALIEHVQLLPQELRMDMRFVKQMEREKRQRIREVKRELAWEEEKNQLALEKVRNWFKDSCAVTLVAIASEHRVSTYSLPPVSERAQDPIRRPSRSSSSSSSSTKTCKGRVEPGRGATTSTEEEVLAAPVGPQTPAVKPAERQEMKKATENAEHLQWDPAEIQQRKTCASEEEVVLSAPVEPRPPAVQLEDREVERQKKAAEKAEQARAAIQKRKEEWARLYAEKPDQNHDNLQDLQAIAVARDTLDDLEFKSSPDLTVPKHLWVNAGKKREELRALKEEKQRKQTEMNARNLVLRDSKLQLVSRLQTLRTQLRRVQRRLPAESRLPCPALPHMQPEETPKRRRQVTHAALQRYKELRDARSGVEEQDQDGAGPGGELWREMDEGLHADGQTDTPEETPSPSDSDLESEGEGPEERTELEVNVQMEEQIWLLHQQDCIIEQMQSTVCEWDAALRMLLHEKLLLDQELKLADLQKLTMMQELQLLKQSESRELSLQNKLSVKAKEEGAIRLTLEELNVQLKSKHQWISKLEEQEKALTTAFVASLGENNKFAEFLTRVFKKKIKRLKNEKTAEEEQEEEDEEWDEEEEEDDEDVDEEGSPVNDSVCPPNCDPALFKNTLQLRERKLDLKEELQEARKSAEALQKECEIIAKKEKNVQSSRKAVEDDLELMHGEVQLKINQLDVVVPLRLHQIELLSDLSQALVLERSDLEHLQRSIPELQLEKNQQRELFKQARQQHAHLLKENAEMDVCIQELNRLCYKRMMKRFGRIVDLDALQTYSGSNVLEELKQEKRLRDPKYDHELSQWDLKVQAARDDLMKATKTNSERMASLIQLRNENRDLELKLSARQKMIGKESEDTKSRYDQQDIKHLQEVVRAQDEQAAALRAELQLLWLKGGHILPPGPAPRPQRATHEAL